MTNVEFKRIADRWALVPTSELKKYKSDYIVQAVLMYRGLFKQFPYISTWENEKIAMKLGLYACLFYEKFGRMPHKVHVDTLHGWIKLK